MPSWPPPSRCGEWAFHNAVISESAAGWPSATKNRRSLPWSPVSVIRPSCPAGSIENVVSFVAVLLTGISVNTSQSVARCQRTRTQPLNASATTTSPTAPRFMVNARQPNGHRT